jgi:hypothetical protein
MPRITRIQLDPLTAAHLGEPIAGGAMAGVMDHLRQSNATAGPQGDGNAPARDSASAEAGDPAQQADTPGVDVVQATGDVMPDGARKPGQSPGIRQTPSEASSDQQVSGVAAPHARPQADRSPNVPAPSHTSTSQDDAASSPPIETSAPADATAAPVAATGDDVGGPAPPAYPISEPASYSIINIGVQYNHQPVDRALNQLTRIGY